MSKQKRSIILLIIFLMINTLFSFGLVSNAEEGEKEDISNYSEEYKKYLELSDEEKSKIEVIPRKYNVPLDSLYEDSNNQQYLTLGDSIEDPLPSSFDLRNVINVQVEDQKSYGLCWDFASMKSLETNLALRGEDYDFSELHVDYMESNLFDGWRELHDGGNFYMFEDYLEKEYGPVYEIEVPYDAVYSEADYEYLLNLEPKAYVYETIDFPTINKSYDTYTDEELNLFQNKVKKHLMENGSLYCVIATPDWGTAYFNNENNAEYFTGDWSQCYAGREAHAVSIIGWDDNYSRNNFNENQRPEKDGAYIALNSWGDWWGDNGIFYISYEDYYVGTQISGIVEAGADIPEHEEIVFKDRNLYNAIKNELAQKIDSFDDNKMSINISKLSASNLNSLYLEDKSIVNITGLEKFYNLENLWLDSNNIENIDYLLNLKNLKNLSLNNCNISQLPDMSSLTNLKNLYLDSNNIKITKLPLDLEVLELRNCNLSQLPDISYLTNLKYLTLSSNNIEEIDLLSLHNLEYLEMDGSPIKRGKINAKIISLCDCNIDDEILGNLQFENTKNIILSNNKIINTNSLNDYELEEIYLNDNPIEDLSGLKNVPIINISHTNIKDVNDLEKVTYLDISGNQNVKNIEKLKNLESLIMMECNLSDLNFLISLKNLKYLGIEFNNISDLSPLSNLPNLTDVFAQSNKISYIPNGLNCENIWLEDQQVSFNVDDDIIVNQITRINLNNIFSYDKSNPYNEQVSFETENCTVELGNKMLAITPTNLGSGKAVLKVNYGRFWGSTFTINYNAIKPKTNIENYLFDAKFYADNNLDVRNAFGYNETQLRNHYYNYGIREGRVASPVFDVRYYLNNNSDVQKSFGTDYSQAFYHFIYYGIHEGRRGSKEFDVKYYLKQYSDVANAFNNDYADSLVHYVQNGRREGRYGSEDVVSDRIIRNNIRLLFDKDLYYALYSDLQKNIGKDENALREHYINYGINEGRTASYVFDPQFYLNKYSDLKNVFENNYKQTAIHFLVSGSREGRCASKLFDVTYYASWNQDVMNFYKSYYPSIMYHFVENGIFEGRSTSSEFNVAAYRNKNSDLSKAFGNDWKQYYYHYMIFGKNEGRICK